MRVTVLGAGAWGTTLARLLARGGHSVTLWGHDAAHLQELARTGMNDRYLPGIKLPTGIRFEAELHSAVDGADAVVVAVPSKVFRDVTRGLSHYNGILVAADRIEGRYFVTGDRQSHHSRKRPESNRASGDLTEDDPPVVITKP